ncbi:SSI family serine proteinase inhibitor [Streptomyces sp. NBC_00289]|uniref:SSI family serine proteinase inhibitor n=1 Tax=Streptomyces sp. NBC_00289 TaxID=2975703 RepID=UPI003246825B
MSQVSSAHSPSGPHGDVHRPFRSLPHSTPRLARLLVVAAGSLVAAGSVSAAPAAAGTVVLPLLSDGAGGDHLTVTVRHAGGSADGTYELDCHPGGGSHPDVGAACAALDRNTRWGRDTFAPVPDGSVCTMQYGGPATAHVTGTWAGRPVDATYDRGDGCRIARWDRLVPFLPEVGP